MQIKQAQNNVTQNTPLDPITGFAEVGDSTSTVQLTVDRTGHVVMAESVDIENLPNAPITLSGDTSDVVDGSGESVDFKRLFINQVGRIVIKHDGTLPYNHDGYALVKQGEA